MTTGGPARAGRWAAPVDPDADEARRLLREELSKPPYEAARPTWFDRLSQSIFDWFESLTVPSGDAVGPWLPVIVVSVAAALLVAALLIFGTPRINRRSTALAGLFSDDDQRTAGDMRRAARGAAAVEDWDGACLEMFRAIARGLAERTLIDMAPGTTAHDSAAAAGRVFPGHQPALSRAAQVFDGVRYLGRTGTRQHYLALEELEQALRDLPPAPAPPVSPASPSRAAEVR